MSPEFLDINGMVYAVSQRGAGQPLILLHGFTGSARSWEGIVAGLSNRFRCVAIDLPGHGESGSTATSDRFQFNRVMADLVEIGRALGLQGAAWLGYSMGGRLALGLAVTYPGVVGQLILESASPGLQDVNDRVARQAADAALAQTILRDGVPSFVAAWERMPLWKSQTTLPTDAAAQQRAIRLANHPAGLAGALRGMGTGAQPSFWECLAALSVPTLLITGEQDQKFDRIARAMHSSLPRSHHVSVVGAGHAVHLEAPVTYVDQVTAFLAERAASREHLVGGNQ